MKQKTGSIRTQVLDKYGRICVHCSFGVEGVLEVAHLDQDRQNNSIANLAPMCPTCHRMHDVGLIPTAVVRTMRAHKKEIDWKLLMKDAGQKAATTRKNNSIKKKKKASAAAKKAWESRKLSAKARPN